MRAEERARTEREGSTFFSECEPSWVDEVFLSSREKLDSEVANLVVFSCRKQRQQMDGEGGSGGKVEYVEIEEDEDYDVEEYEEELSDEEETDGSRTAYKKNRWRAAAEIITAEFNIAGGPTHSWGEPTDKKIGPCSSRSVSVNNFIYVFLAIEKLWVLIC